LTEDRWKKEKSRDIFLHGSFTKVNTNNIEDNWIEKNIELPSQLPIGLEKLFGEKKSTSSSSSSSSSSIATISAPNTPLPRSISPIDLIQKGDVFFLNNALDTMGSRNGTGVDILGKLQVLLYCCCPWVPVFDVVTNTVSFQVIFVNCVDR
jgi:hypothetical protein